MFTKDYFNNKNVFITGASKGIGKAIADAFYEFGANVITPNHQEMDLLNSKSIDNFLKEHRIKVDIFIHSAGVNPLADSSQITNEIMDSTFQINCCSAVQLAKEFIPYMKSVGEGKIVFLSSLYSEITKEKRLAYTASKHAIRGVAKNLALELAPYNILVNAVAPGYVLTDMTKKNLSEREINLLANDIPTNRLQTPEEIANICMFLCSNYNKSITGQTIFVDGGFLCK